MNCPKCGRPLTYLNQDYRTHGWYCLEAICKAQVKCDQDCCKGKPVVIEKRRKEDWVPKKGDRVWVSGKTWSCEGTITGFAKDDSEVPWIKVDKDGTSWDARDLGSVRKLEEGDQPK